MYNNVQDSRNPKNYLAFSKPALTPALILSISADTPRTVFISCSKHPRRQDIWWSAAIASGSEGKHRKKFSASPLATQELLLVRLESLEIGIETMSPFFS
jgi:hypothetical protein